MKNGTVTFLFLLVVLVGMIFGFVILINWWLESRFGANVAILSWGGALALGCVVIGAVIVIITQRITINGIADVVHDSAQAHKTQIGVFREYAKLERDAFNHRAKLDVLDERRVMKLADQQARLLQVAQEEVDEDDWYADIDNVEYKEIR